jgi:hypothetical protein
VDRDQALSLITGGESLTLELKASLSSRKPEGICKEIAALATSKGGHLLVGVSDDLQVIGVADAVALRDKIERWTVDLVSPTPLIDPRVVAIDEKEIVVVGVAKGASPIYSYDGRFYGRVGTSSCVLNPRQLIDVIRGRKIEDVISSLESSVAVAQSIASTALVSTAPAITAQGELATMNYGQVRQRIFDDLRTSPAFASLEASVAIAQSTASLALGGPASSIRGQGELATMNYEQIKHRLLADLTTAVAITAMRSELAALHSQLFMAETKIQSLETRLAKLNKI